MGTSPSGKAYIGQARGDARHKGDGFVRFRQHANREKTAIHDAIKYYGIDAFKVEILVRAPDEMLNALEVKLIAAYGTFGKWGYNLTRGGDINPMHEQSVRAKCVATHGRPEVKAKHKAAMKRTMSEPDVRKRISGTMKKQLANPKARAQRAEQLAAIDQTKRKTALKHAIKQAHKTPGFTNRVTAGFQATRKDPVKNAKRIAALKKTLNDPAVHARRVQAIKDGWARRLGKA
jgi:hypothetical protein